MQATHSTFAAVLADGSVVTWGGGSGIMQVQDKLKKVQQIRATHHAFAAILADGSVVTWGNGFCGGDSSQVQQEHQGVQQSSFAATIGRWNSE